LYVLPVYIWVTGQDSAHQRLVSTIDKTAPGPAIRALGRRMYAPPQTLENVDFSIPSTCTTHTPFLSRRVSASPPSTPRSFTLFNARLIALTAIPVRLLLAYSLLIWSHSARILPSSCQIHVVKTLGPPARSRCRVPINSTQQAGNLPFVCWHWALDASQVPVGSYTYG
jgi:hypothetical protein